MVDIDRDKLLDEGRKEIRLKIREILMDIILEEVEIMQNDIFSKVLTETKNWVDDNIKDGCRLYEREINKAEESYKKKEEESYKKKVRKDAST